MTDADGEIFQHLEYFPFGETWVEESSNTQRTPYLFTGKELDEETELYYFGARYYDPRTSVWQSPDPVLATYLPTPGQSTSAINGLGGVYNTNNLGLYSYAHNRPIIATDPNGEIVWFAVIGVALLVADYGITAYDQYTMHADWQAGKMSDAEYASWTAANAAMTFVPYDKLVKYGFKGFKAAFKTATHIPWATGVQGIKAQGAAWEAILKEGRLSGYVDLNDLVKNHKGFDFFDEATGHAVSAKSMNVLTDAKLANPASAGSTLRGYIDEAANYTKGQKQPNGLDPSMIKSRSIELSIPDGAPKAIMDALSNAAAYGKTRGVDVIITVIQ